MKNRKVVLITGCSSGFGHLTALKFARSGWWTFASMRNLESAGARDLWEIRSRENLTLELIPIDVRSDRSVREGVEMVSRKAGRVDVLVNNAGFGFSGPVELFEIDEVKSQYETNLFGVLRMVKAIIPLMRQQHSGTIINISSIAGLIVSPLNGVYSSSKFSLEALSEALAFELKHFGINVCLLEPGSFLTNFWQNIQHPAAAKMEDSAYRDLTEKFFARQKGVKDKIRKGFLSRFFAPQKVVERIYKVAQEKNPALRQRIGWDTNFYYLRKFLPQRVWFFLLRTAYRW